jgi:hypothetical protein
MILSTIVSKVLRLEDFCLESLMMRVSNFS